MPLKHLASNYISPSSLPPFPHYQFSTIVEFFTTEREREMMMRAVGVSGGKNPLYGSTQSSPAPLNQALKLIPSNLGGIWGQKSTWANGGAIVAALQEGVSGSASLTGIVFQPFEEVKSESFMVPIQPQASLARQRYVDECEAAINEQINVEYSASYVYHSLFAYFDRDNVSLKGLAKFFKESSEEEREHAEKLMKYQNMRGGRVKLYTITMPPSEFDHAEKGDALYAMELALSLEKLVNEKLLTLHSVAEKNNDPQLQEFVEGEFLNEQVDTIKKIADYVTQLRMVGKGHGVWHFDQMLLHEGGAL